MSQVLVRGLAAGVVERLKARARQHGRSLQAELKAIIEQAAQTEMRRARSLAAQIRKRLKGRSHHDSAELLSEDRAR
jgi:plasmid stability protein